ncbi:hypothetical protein [Pseudonocardia adelaidensis]|uniref:hypothetical protein n=1 Tax=Pseudonocardia adelaidensis TaxID=648754 RepID=UPI0031EEE61C
MSKAPAAHSRRVLAVQGLVLGDAGRSGCRDPGPDERHDRCRPLLVAGGALGIGDPGLEQCAECLGPAVGPAGLHDAVDEVAAHRVRIAAPHLHLVDRGECGEALPRLGGSAYRDAPGADGPQRRGHPALADDMPVDQQLEGGEPVVGEADGRPPVGGGNLLTDHALVSGIRLGIVDLRLEQGRVVGDARGDHQPERAVALDQGPPAQHGGRTIWA